MNIIEQIEQEQQKALDESKKVPEFAPGDTVRVNVRIKELHYWFFPIFAEIRSFERSPR